MMDIEERLNILETNVKSIVSFIYAMQQTAMTFSFQPPPPRLPFEREEPPALLTARTPHFGLDPQQRTHWADVYSRLVRAGKLCPDEVTSAHFSYLMCGEGTPAPGPIRWHGSTRELAYMVRQHLGSRWSVALAAFNDKNDRPLPPSFQNSKPPAAPSAAKIDLIFRSRD